MTRFPDLIRLPALSWKRSSLTLIGDFSHHAQMVLHHRPLWHCDRRNCFRLCTKDTRSPPAPMALQVRSEFLYSWNAYKRYAWGHDELKPLSLGYRDWYSSSLLMTPVDALDTMILMGLTEEADKTREYIDKNLLSIRTLKSRILKSPSGSWADCSAVTSSPATNVFWSLPTI